jgi:2-polyprenyl-3-methyl-5-hydroxy-6-metoxy-1,4-benzoquinol methylase
MFESGVKLSHCPLCLSEAVLQVYHQDGNRTYLGCNCCGLVKLADQHHLSSTDEKAQYDLHQNNPDDPGYRKFLSRTFTPLLTRISKQAVGLDFGCGPGPTISILGEESGVRISNYDLYYFNQGELLEQQYDFVTMTEVIEHIAQPNKLLKRLDLILKPNAILAIMTKRLIDNQQFKTWHYKNDPTHICFYSLDVFHWIAQKFNWRLEVIDKDVVFFYKL